MKKHVPKYALASNEGFVRWACRILKCDCGKISDPSGRVMYFSEGTKTSTKQDTQRDGSVWVNEKGEQVDWDYVSECIVAIGSTRAELAAEVLARANLAKKSMLDVMLEQVERTHGKSAARAQRREFKKFSGSHWVALDFKTVLDHN